MFVRFIFKLQLKFIVNFVRFQALNFALHRTFGIYICLSDVYLMQLGIFVSVTKTESSHSSIKFHFVKLRIGGILKHKNGRIIQ